MKLTSAFNLLALVAFVGACSTARVNVMPGEEYNRVVSKDIESDDAETAGVEAANEYCRKRGQEAVFLKEETSYKGSMDEEDRKLVRNASKAAMIVGGVGVGSRSTRPMGGVLGSAGTVGYSMTNDRDYQSEIRFKCR